MSCQKLIGALLDSINTKVFINNRINAELESMAKTIYDYWFTQFDFPNEDGKPYKSSGGKMVWNEELKRKIPVGWKVKKVGDLLSKIPNTRKYKTNEYLQDGTYPVIDQSEKYICGYTNNNGGLLNLNDCIVLVTIPSTLNMLTFRFVVVQTGHK